MLGGDLKDIKSRDEKKGGKMLQKTSFQSFRTFIAKMEMADIVYRGETFTWANNRDGKGFIQERLDRFCGSAEWIIQNEQAE